jgi:hypothetical protein
VRAVRRWQTVPADVRRLIWADRQARWRVVIAGSALGLFWLGLLALLVGVVLAA